MTDAQLDLLDSAIAEWSGWRRLENGSMWQKGLEKRIHRPSYIYGLEALGRMHEAETHLRQNEQLWWNYTGYLLMQVGAENREGINNYAKLSHATALQRARALCDTIPEIRGKIPGYK